jgi:hypothetical protein
MLVEFLMPATKDEGIRDLPALGVSAMALRHLDYLFADPIPAASFYRSGVLVQIPRPERYAIHKLIVAERRIGGTDAAKSSKDRAKAAFLGQVCAETRLKDGVFDQTGEVQPLFQRVHGAGFLLAAAPDGDLAPTGFPLDSDD